MLIGAEVFRVILMSISNYRYPFKVLPLFLIAMVGVLVARVTAIALGV